MLARALVAAALAVLGAAPATQAAPLRVGPATALQIGFRTEAGWFHATRLHSPGTFATTDPSGRRLRVRVVRSGAGVTALSARPTGAGVERVRIAFAARRGERYLGFGERSNAVDQRGNEVESYVAEGPFEEDERPAVPAFVPPWGFHPRDDATYFPMPWLLSTAGHGVLVDNAETSVFRLAGRRSWSVEVEAAALRLRVFDGPRPADALRRMTARIGRQPAPPGPFVLGPWYQPRADEQAPPVSLAQTYTHYLPCEAQRDRRDAERERVRRFHAAGLAITTYFNPMICTTHTRFGRPGTLLLDPTGQPYVFRYSTLESFSVAQIDFTSAAGRALYQGMGATRREVLGPYRQQRQVLSSQGHSVRSW